MSELNVSAVIMLCMYALWTVWKPIPLLFVIISSKVDIYVDGVCALQLKKKTGSCLLTLLLTIHFTLHVNVHVAVYFSVYCIVDFAVYFYIYFNVSTLPFRLLFPLLFSVLLFLYC